MEVCMKERKRTGSDMEEESSAMLMVGSMMEIGSMERWMVMGNCIILMKN